MDNTNGRTTTATARASFPPKSPIDNGSPSGRGKILNPSPPDFGAGRDALATRSSRFHAGTGGESWEKSWMSVRAVREAGGREGRGEPETTAPTMAPTMAPNLYAEGAFSDISGAKAGISGAGGGVYGAQDTPRMG